MAHRVQHELTSLRSQPLHWPRHSPSDWLTFSVLSHTSHFPTLFTSVINEIKYTPHFYTRLMNIPNLCKQILLIWGSYHLLTISNLLSSLEFTMQPLLHIIHWILSTILSLNNIYNDLVDCFLLSWQALIPFCVLPHRKSHHSIWSPKERQKDIILKDELPRSVGAQ